MDKRITTIALGACLIGVIAAPATAGSATGGKYKGKTSKGFPVSFRIAGGKVRGFDATVHALCLSVADGSSYLDPVLHHVTPPAGKLKRNGKFTLKVSKGSTRMNVTGLVRGKKASGTYHINYSGFNGTWVTACTDGGKWKAHR